MSFGFNSKSGSFDATHAGMARIRAILAEKDLLDGPCDARETYAFQRAAANRVVRPRVRVWTIRTNNHRLSPSECRIVAAALEHHEDEFVRAFGEFCALAATEGGAWEGAESCVAEAEPWRAEPPELARDADLEARIARRLDATLVWLRADGIADGPTLDGLAAVERLGESDDIERARNLTIFVLECLRRAHGGVFGRIGENFFGVRLDNGIVVSGELPLSRFYVDEGSVKLWEPPFTLVEYARAPVQL